MSDDAVNVECIDFDLGHVVLEDGTTLPITDFFDEDGEECDEEDAVAIVAGTTEFGWLTIDLHDFEEEAVTVH